MNIIELPEQMGAKNIELDESGLGEYDTCLTFDFNDKRAEIKGDWMNSGIINKRGDNMSENLKVSLFLLFSLSLIAGAVFLAVESSNRVESEKARLESNGYSCVVSKKETGMPHTRGKIYICVKDGEEVRI